MVNVLNSKGEEIKKISRDIFETKFPFLYQTRNSDDKIIINYKGFDLLLGGFADGVFLLAWGVDTSDLEDAEKELGADNVNSAIYRIIVENINNNIVNKAK